MDVENPGGVSGDADNPKPCDALFLPSVTQGLNAPAHGCCTRCSGESHYRTLRPSAGESRSPDAVSGIAMHDAVAEIPDDGSVALHGCGRLPDDLRGLPL